MQYYGLIVTEAIASLICFEYSCYSTVLPYRDWKVERRTDDSRTSVAVVNTAS